MTKKTYLDLVGQLKEDLSKDSHTEFQATDIPGVGLLHQVMTPHQGMPRYMCVVLEVAESVSNSAQCKELLEKIRGFLTHQYARFPGMKDGAFIVLFCSHQLYEHLKGSEEKFRDLSGLHRIVILGTVFVDRDLFASSAVETWGLWYSGKYFTNIKRVVQEWCRQNHKA